MNTGVTENKKLSVVIASIVRPPFIDDCLASVEKESKELGDEVIIVACGRLDYAKRIQGNFPWVRMVHRPERETVPELRAIGVEQAKGEIVAIIEEHCLAGHERRGYAAVGGPVVDHAYKRPQDWVVYFCEYNGYLPPWVDGDAYDLNGANIAYRETGDQGRHNAPTAEIGFYVGAGCYHDTWIRNVVLG